MIYMSTKILALLFWLLGVWNNAASQGQNEKIRLELVRNFLLDLRSDYTSNSTIMEKYIQSAGYFAVDSIRQMADEWMNHTRTNLKSIGLEHMEILKYLEHEDEFMTMDNPPGMPLAPAILQKLSFTLDTPTARNLSVNLNDLYVVRITNKHKLFVLFNEHDKILSFSYLQFGRNIGLWQW